MKKLNLIIGKRQIMIAALLVTLSTAAVLNFYYAAGDESVTVFDDTGDKGKDLKNNNENKEVQKYGQTQLVNNNVYDLEKFNRRAAFEKKQDEIKKFDKNGNINLTNEQKERLMEQFNNNNKEIDQSEKIENLTKTSLKGDINDCIAFVDRGSAKANVYVTSKDDKDLTSNDMIKIQKITQDTTNFKPQNITITQSVTNNKHNDQR